MSPPTVPLYTLDELDELRRSVRKSLQEKIEENISVNVVERGPLNTGAFHKIINHIRAQNGTRNAYIIFGEDRPAGRNSGYGGEGASPYSKGTNRVEIVVGKMARANQGKGPSDGTYADPSPFGDAAKIYISDMTRADENFGFCEAQIGNIKGQSAIVTFADQVRIFGVGGVQISTGQPQAKTGPSGVSDSVGNKLPIAPPIILSAGNVDYTVKNPFKTGPYEEVPVLQGVVKGETMIMCMRELAWMLDKVIGALIRMGAYQGVFAATLGIQVPPVINPHYPAICGTLTKETFAGFLQTLASLRVEKGAWETNYLERGSKLIKSTNVFTS